MAFGKKSEKEQETPDFTEEELHTIIANGMAILNGTHPTAGPQWSPVVVPIIRSALRELTDKQAEK